MRSCGEILRKMIQMIVTGSIFIQDCKSCCHDVDHKSYHDPQHLFQSTIDCGMIALCVSARVQSLPCPASNTKNIVNEHIMLG